MTSPSASKTVTTRPPLFRLRAWFSRHAQVAVTTLGQLARNPIASLMTICVIGIALALPSGLFAVIGNLQQLAVNWAGSASISVFLKPGLDTPKASALAQRLAKVPSIARVQVVTPAEALQEFRQYSGFGAALDLLPENPLPALLLVEPAPSIAKLPATADSLAAQLKALPEAELVQIDLLWVKRFQAMMEIAQRTVALVGVLLGLAVLLVIGNTIRLEIENRRAEIVIVKLVGGTDAFVRRPFLYSGLWYGLGGGLLAYALVSLSLWLLAGPVQRLAGLYQSQFNLGQEAILPLLVLGTGALLGLLGSWLSVSRHLAAIEPN